MKKTMVIIVLFSMLLCINGCANSDVAIGTSAEIEVEAQVSANEQEQYDGIIAYYDTLVELKETLTNHSYESLNQTMEEVAVEVEKFENLPESENEEYNTYINMMKVNPMFEIFKTYTDGTYNLDYYMTTDVYVVFITDSVNILLQEPLPFEYEAQVSVEEEKETSSDYVEAANQFRSVVNTAANEGIEINFDRAYGAEEWYYVFTNDYTLDTGYSSISLVKAGMYYTEDGNYAFYIQTTHDDAFYVINKFKISNGTEEVIVNSTQMDDFGLGYIRYMYMYKSEWDESMNSNFEMVRDIFENSEHVYVAMDDEEYVELPAEYIERIREYFELFDALKMIYINSSN